MEEVSNPYGMSGASGEDPAMLAASWQGQEIKDKEVVDVNGQKLGRVSRAFGEEGALVRFDVHLSEQAKQLLVIEPTREILGVPADAIARVDDEGVRLKQAAEQIARPEDPRPAHASADERGAPRLPRKER